MKVAIGLPHMTESYDARFGDCLTGLVHRSFENGISLMTISTYREPVTFARNRIATKAIESDADCLLFLDDDMVFSPDLLVNLLKREKDVVGALTFIRSGPHEPSFYMLSSDGKTYNPIYMWQPGELTYCDAVGMAATLVRRGVLEKMVAVSQKWKGNFGFFEGYAEDFSFCRKARELGYDVWCDTSQLVGHISTKIVGYPDYAAMVEEKMYDIKRDQKKREYDRKIEVKK